MLIYFPYGMYHQKSVEATNPNASKRAPSRGKPATGARRNEQVRRRDGYLYFYFFIYLVALSLSCAMQDLWLWPMGSLVVAHGLQSGGSVVQCAGFVALQHVGSSFPNQGSNPHPLHCRVDS